MPRKSIIIQNIVKMVYQRYFKTFKIVPKFLKVLTVQDSCEGHRDATNIIFTLAKLPSESYLTLAKSAKFKGKKCRLSERCYEFRQHNTHTLICEHRRRQKKTLHWLEYFLFNQHSFVIMWHSNPPPWRVCECYMHPWGQIDRHSNSKIHLLFC